MSSDTTLRWANDHDAEDLLGRGARRSSEEILECPLTSVTSVLYRPLVGFTTILSTIFDLTCGDPSWDAIDNASILLYFQL